jgi:hypothetical protein
MCKLTFKILVEGEMPLPPHRSEDLREIVESLRFKVKSRRLKVESSYT